MLIKLGFSKGANPMKKGGEITSAKLIFAFISGVDRFPLTDGASEASAGVTKCSLSEHTFILSGLESFSSEPQCSPLPRYHINQLFTSHTRLFTSHTKKKFLNILARPYSLLRELHTQINIIRLCGCTSRRSKALDRCHIDQLLSTRTRQPHRNWDIERPCPLWYNPRTISLLRPRFGVIWVMDQRRPGACSSALDLDLDDRADACGVDSCESEVVWSTTVPEPDVNITGCGAWYTFVPCWNHTVGEGAVSLETAHGDI